MYALSIDSFVYTGLSAVAMMVVAGQSGMAQEWNVGRDYMVPELVRSSADTFNKTDQKEFRVAGNIVNETGWEKGSSFAQWRKKAHAFRQKGQLSRAEYALRKALVLAVAAEDKKQQTLVSIELGSIYFGLKQFADAARFYRKAVTLADINNDRTNSIVARFNLALLERKSGRLATAEKLLAVARAKLEMSDDPELRTKLLFNHGRILRELHKNKLAASTLNHVARLADEKGYPDISAAANAELAAVQRSNGDLKTASQSFGKSLKLFGEVNDRDAIASVYSELGNVHLRRREYDLAKDMFRRSLAINKDAGNTLEQARQYMLLAELFDKLGDADNVCANVKGAKALTATENNPSIWDDIRKKIEAFKCSEDDNGLAWAKAQLSGQGEAGQ